MRHANRRQIAAIATAALVLLAGCAANGTSPSASPTAEPVTSPMPTATATLAASASPSPSPSPSRDVGGCVNASVDYAPDARGQKRDPIDLAKAALSGLREADTLTRVAGADSTAQVVITRDGQEIGRVQFAQDAHGGWLLGQATLCGGLGLPS